MIEVTIFGAYQFDWSDRLFRGFNFKKVISSLTPQQNWSAFTALIGSKYSLQNWHVCIWCLVHGTENALADWRNSHKSHNQIQTIKNELYVYLCVW